MKIYKYAKPSYTGELRGFEELSKQEQNEITRILWPHQVRKSQRAQLRLIRCIDQLNADELAIELEKRDIQIRIIRIHCGDPSTEEECHRERQKRLMKYLNNEDCKKVYEMIVKGYCRISQNEIDNQYLQDIVHKYYPPFLNKINGLL